VALAHWLTVVDEVLVFKGQLDEDSVGLWELEVERERKGDKAADAHDVEEKIVETELRSVLDTEELGIVERENEWVGDVDKETDVLAHSLAVEKVLDEGVLVRQRVGERLTLIEAELVKQSVGELEWVEERLTDTVPQCEPELLLHPDTVTLANWLTLWVKVIVPEEQRVRDTVGDRQLEAVWETLADGLEE
jgi:hypothetical protein